MDKKGKLMTNCWKTYEKDKKRFLKKCHESNLQQHEA
jgi:hypothetical protein